MDEPLLKSGQFPNVAIIAGSDPKEVMREYANDDSHDALKKQINRFNASKSEENAENDTSKGVINNFDVQNDSREKLEADLGDVVTILRMAANGGFDGSTGNVMKNAKVLLDMPKERALDSEVFHAFADMVEWERAELTAERDQLSRDLDAEHALVVQFEYDNEEIKADLKTANDTINTLRASVAGLKETVEKLGAQ